MAAWTSLLTDALWRSALGAIPIALASFGICRCLPCRASTRHALWLVVLGWFAIGPILPDATRDRLLIPPTSVPPAEEPIEPHHDEIFAETIDAGSAGLFQEALPTGRHTAPAPARSRMPATHPARSSPQPAYVSGRLTTMFDANERSSAGADNDPPIGGGLSLGQQHYFATAPSHWTFRGTPDQDPNETGSRPTAQSPSLFESGLRSKVRSDRAAPPWYGAGRDSQTHATPLDSVPMVLAGPGLRKSQIVKPRKINVEFQHPPASASAKEPPTVESDITVLTVTEIVSTQWHYWMDALVAARDTLGHIPTLPAIVWLAGVGAVLLGRFVRSMVFRNRLRHCYPASGDVLGVVRVAANALGLKHPPPTFLSPGQFSPMVVCGRRARLIIPDVLWRQLDGAGRRAVVAHELAHLARRDHWVCHAESAISCLYWWHPVVWWVRRRLREESDLCCDAWVTWLMPNRRREYAQALLATRRYMSEASPLAARAICMVSPPAKRFASRLTLIMTAPPKPGISLSGLFLVIVVGVMGWVVTPAWSHASSADLWGQAACVCGDACKRDKHCICGCQVHSGGVDPADSVGRSNPSDNPNPFGLTGSSGNLSSESASGHNEGTQVEPSQAWPEFMASESRRAAMPLDERVVRLELTIDRMTERVEQILSVYLATEQGDATQSETVQANYLAMSQSDPADRTTTNVDPATIVYALQSQETYESLLESQLQAREEAIAVIQRQIESFRVRAAAAGKELNQIRIASKSVADRIEEIRASLLLKGESRPTVPTITELKSLFAREADLAEQARLAGERAGSIAEQVQRLGSDLMDQIRAADQSRDQLQEHHRLLERLHAQLGA